MPGSQGGSAWAGRRAPRWVAIFLLAAMATGCPAPSRPVGVRPALSDRTVRDVRVLLTVSHDDVRVRGEYTIRDRAGRVLGGITGRRWAVVSGGPDIVLGSQSLGSAGIEIVPATAAPVAISHRTETGWSPARQYRGFLRLLAQPDGGVKVINVVDVESYVAGVLPGEIYPTFHPESFRAQAIAARTYCLYAMSARAQSDYDLTAGEGAQVYEGISDTTGYRKACAAGEATRGLVCTWKSPVGERVFCTYFSSACGGVTQPVNDGASKHNIPPLAGGVRCDYCRIAKGEAYRWKPRSITAAKLMARVSRRYPQAAKLGRLRDLRVTRRTADGHIRQVRLVGQTGESLTLGGEDFRLAVGSRVMRSTDCDLRLDGASLIFENGKGFGHGMGLCQWGMEGQARQGRTAAQILRFYYPESHLSRAY